VAGIEASGEVVAEDYRTVPDPAVAAAIKARGRVRLLYLLGDAFTGYSAAAMWEDTKLGFHDLSAWERIAVGTDHTALADAIRVFGWLIPAEVRTCATGQPSRATLRRMTARWSEPITSIGTSVAGGPAGSRASTSSQPSARLTWISAAKAEVAHAGRLAAASPSSRSSIGMTQVATARPTPVGRTTTTFAGNSGPNIPVERPVDVSERRRGRVTLRLAAGAQASVSASPRWRRAYPQPMSSTPSTARTIPSSWNVFRSCSIPP
jgi:hypothetical protein